MVPRVIKCFIRVLMSHILLYHPAPSAWSSLLPILCFPSFPRKLMSHSSPGQPALPPGAFCPELAPPPP